MTETRYARTTRPQEVDLTGKLLRDELAQKFNTGDPNVVRSLGGFAVMIHEPFFRVENPIGTMVRGVYVERTEVLHGRAQDFLVRDGHGVHIVAPPDHEYSALEDARIIRLGNTENIPARRGT